MIVLEVDWMYHMQHTVQVESAAETNLFKTNFATNVTRTRNIKEWGRRAQEREIDAECFIHSTKEALL